jgi:hypothetical protein
VYHRIVGKSDEPMVKRFYVTASLDAARSLWGDGAMADVAARMSVADRDAVHAPHLPLWVREHALIAWNFALWEGPVDRKRQRYEAWLHRMTDLSFGVVKRLVLSMASPEKVLTSAADLWKSDHTHGRMLGHCDGNRGIVTLVDSPYVETPQGRAGIAEMLRYIMQLAGARGAIERHALVPPRALEVRLHWAGTKRAAHS